MNPVGTIYETLPTLRHLSIPEIRAHRQARADAGEDASFRDYFDFNGICYTCKGVGRKTYSDHLNRTQYETTPCPDCGGLTHPFRVLTWQSIAKVEYVKGTYYYCSTGCAKDERELTGTLDPGETADRCFTCNRGLNITRPISGF